MLLEETGLIKSKISVWLSNTSVCQRKKYYWYIFMIKNKVIHIYIFLVNSYNIKFLKKTVIILNELMIFFIKKYNIK